MTRALQTDYTTTKHAASCGGHVPLNIQTVYIIRYFCFNLLILDFKEIDNQECNCRRCKIAF